MVLLVLYIVLLEAGRWFYLKMSDVLILYCYTDELPPNFLYGIIINDLTWVVIVVSLLIIIIIIIFTFPRWLSEGEQIFIYCHTYLYVGDFRDCRVRTQFSFRLLIKSWSRSRSQTGLSPLSALGRIYSEENACQCANVNAVANLGWDLVRDLSQTRFGPELYLWAVV